VLVHEKDVAEAFSTDATPRSTLLVAECAVTVAADQKGVALVITGERHFKH
jgi:hypothetical protein